MFSIFFFENKFVFFSLDTTGFSFTKTLQQISSNPNSNNASIFSNTNFSLFQPTQQSFFGQSQQQSSTIGGGGGGFSFNQTLKQLNNVPNVGMPMNSLFNNNESEMKSDFHHSSSTSLFNFPANNTFTFGNTAALNSANIVTRQNDAHHWYKSNNDVNNQPVVKSKSFFEQPMPNETTMSSESNVDTKKLGIRYGIYSELKDLIEKDLANFKADKFIHPIPFDPPPFEVCF